jgi:TRAP-type C4-dicarboxylate transport system permease small subunit
MSHVAGEQVNTLEPAKKIDVIFNYFGKTVGIIGGILLLFIVVFTVADVILRITINSPILGTQELVQFSNLIMSFLMILWSSLAMKHVRMESLQKFFPKVLKIVLDIVFLLLSLAVFVFMTVYNFRYAMLQQQSLETSAITEIPMAIFYFLISVICGLTCLVFLVHITRLTREAIKKWI